VLVSHHVRTRRAVFDSFVLFELCCFSLLLDLVWLFCLAIVFGYCVWLLMAARDRLCVCVANETAAAVLNAATQTATQTPTTTIATTTISTTTATTATTPNSNKRDSSGDVVAEAVSASADAAAAADGGSSADAANNGDEQPPARKVQKNKERCFACRKKVGLLGFTCKCDYVFCSTHRYPKEHDCDFDRSQAAREQIAAQNPVVMADKIAKI